MDRVLKYRSVIVSLVLIFSLFNIGLPIVIASCPMLKYGAPMACCRGDEAPNSVSLTTYNDASCCNTVIVAGRNTNEFVPAKGSAQVQDLQSVLLPISFFGVRNPSFVSCIYLASSSPPTVVDIPIFTSSLLI
jgi:hypothetical protein